MTNMSPIVVGVDGSDSARHALQWALDAAEGLGCAVYAITTWHWDGIEAMPPASVSPAEHRQWAERISARDVGAAIARRGSSRPVVRKVLEGTPGRVLADEARSARMLVLGGHGHSRLHHAVLGSVSEECVRLATCPVVVVPAPRTVTVEEPAAAVAPAN